MAEFEIAPGRMVGRSHPCFIIAEIGQNHQGSLSIAKKMIKIAKECGADCVKFQKSDLSSRFNKAALDRPYLCEQSWGATYGKHRRHLEFSEDQFIELQHYATEIGILFTASGMDKVSIDFLHDIQVPFFKIGSGDANNLPLLIHTAKLGKPMVISTGMQDMSSVSIAYNAVLPLNKHIGILQCISAYPTPYQDINLNVIKTYQKDFPEAVIGYSGHEVGTEISVAAVALGAKILERHLTLDHSWKGSDHVASLEPQEFRYLVSQIRNVEAAFGTYFKTMCKSELACYKKLAKTVVSTEFLPAGTVLTENMLDIKVAEPKGWRADQLFELVGRKLKNDVEKDCSIRTEDVL